ncbi:DUF2514 family protein [Cupriavidus taiwanensis]|uniref:DUF2514 family protein n=1 Tax=Cupriavidus taiwanensis TaxID=164546 RepID=UPI0039C3325C
MTAARWKWLAAAVLGAALFAAGWTANGWRKDAEIGVINDDRSRERRDQAVAQVKAVEDARREEQRRTTAQTEIANAAIQKANAAQADARAADTARRELLARVTALANASRRPGDSGAGGGGAAAADAIHLLADVFGRADARAGELAQFADAVHVAGQACERSYDALNDAAGK